jgi:hypothetical protein
MKKTLDEIELENKQLWAEYAASEKIYYEEEKRWNGRVLKAICNQLGKQFLADVVECFEESEAQGKLQLVRGTTGQWQEEERESFKGVWVDQWAVGVSGDSWEGYVYIELKKGLWLKTYYSM